MVAFCLFSILLLMSFPISKDYINIFHKLCQQKKLEKIFDKYQNKAKDIEKELITFEEKKEKIGKIEIQRYDKGY